MDRNGDNGNAGPHSTSGAPRASASSPAPEPSPGSGSGSETSYGAAARWGLLVGPLAALLVAFLPIASLAPAAQRTAAIAVWMAIWWMTEALPLPATALLPLVAFPASGVLSSSEAAAPYANHLIFLFLGGFFIARAMERWRLHRRLALRIVLRTGTRRRGIVLGIMLATAFLSMWISNTATAVMMLPIGLALVEQLGREEESGGDADPQAFASALMLGIAYAASIGGMATLVGTPPNLVFATMAEQILGRSVGFAEWMLVGVPVAVVMLPLAWLYLTRWATPLGPEPEAGEARAGRDLLRRQLQQMGPMTREERTVLAVFGATAAAWILRQEKSLGAVTLPGIETWLPQVSDTTVAIAGALALFALPLSLRRGRFVLDWETARDIPWGILLLFGGGLSLAQGFETSGLSTWIAGWVLELRGLPTLVVVLAACTLIVLLTELTSNTATATMAMPVFASAAVGLGLDPYALMAPAALAASAAFMLPVATPPNAIVFGSGAVTLREMMRAGLLMNAVSVTVCTVAGRWLVPWAL